MARARGFGHPCMNLRSSVEAVHDVFESFRAGAIDPVWWQLSCSFAARPVTSLSSALHLNGFPSDPLGLRECRYSARHTAMKHLSGLRP